MDVNIYCENEFTVDDSFIPLVVDEGDLDDQPPRDDLPDKSRDWMRLASELVKEYYRLYVYEIDEESEQDASDLFHVDYDIDVINQIVTE